jgi:predicted GNAT family acetyltransferase
MPFIPDKVQEIGINTVGMYCGKGYATDACAECARNIVASGRVPQWSTVAWNIASQRIAQRVGFAKFSDVLSLKIV